MVNCTFFCSFPLAHRLVVAWLNRRKRIRQFDVRCGRLHDFGDLRLEQVARPQAQETGDVIVRIKSCGICATDYKAIRRIRRNVTFPFIRGHEPSGVVQEIGPGVTHYKPGGEVIVMPAGSCGLCAQCRAGHSHYCEDGFTTGGDGMRQIWLGAFAEDMRTRESCLFHKPAGLSFDAACLSEPLSGAWKGVIQHSEMHVGDDVVIIGVGGIGLLCLMVAKAAGAARLIAIGPSAHARQHALELGAAHAVDPLHEDARGRVYEIMREGPNLVVEAAGPIEAVRLAAELRR